MRTFGTIVILVIIAIAYGAFGSHKRDAPATATVAQSGQSTMERDRPQSASSSFDARSATIAIAARNHASPATHARTGAEIFADTNLPLGQRFHALWLSAQSGDPGAMHLSIQLANECGGIMDVAQEMRQRDAGTAWVTPYYAAARTTLERECDEVKNQIGYQEARSIAMYRTIYAFYGPVERTLKQEFAARGAEAAINVAVSAIRQFPDFTMSAALSNTLDELGLTNYFAELLQDPYVFVARTEYGYCAAVADL